jgi:putative transposase
VVVFLKEIRDQNPEKRILIILDNFKSHHSKLVVERGDMLNIRLVFIPPYSPDLNPIQFIWKSVKRIVSITSINSEMDLKNTMKEGFLRLSCNKSFARSWNRKFLNKSILV